MTQAATNSGKSKFRDQRNSESWFTFNTQPSFEFPSLELCLRVLAYVSLKVISWVQSCWNGL